MQTGPGRFALPVLWDVVNEFFNLNRGIKAGNYTEQQLRTLFGIDARNDATQVIQQYNYDDGLDNYAERTYIWNSGSYEIDDSAVSIVDANGNRHIEHFAVKPLGILNGPTGANGGILDNFDFEGGGLAQTGNAPLETWVDPSGIGIKVNIEITNITNFRSYTIANYAADVQKYNDSFINTALAGVRLSTEMHELAERIFDNGVTKFLDADNKPILYGTDQDDSIFGTLSRAGIDRNTGGTKTIVDIGRFDNPVSGWIQNGIHCIGGPGNDNLTGTDNPDKLVGGTDDDTLDGNGGDDYLEGGDGFDLYFANDGDRIFDSDGRGVVYFNGQELKTATKRLMTNDDFYQDAAGNRYYHQGDDLLVVSGDQSASLVIENFQNQNLGIKLKVMGGSSRVSSWREVTETPITDDIDNVFNVAQRTPPPDLRDPLTLDLDGDGLETTAFSTHPIYFDHDVNGIKEGTGWVLPDDGLLVLDRNGNGVIDDGTELFGDHTPLAGSGFAVDGFAAIAQEDSPVGRATALSLPEAHVAIMLRTMARA